MISQQPQWLQRALDYRDPRVVAIFILSLASGLPFLLTLATLHVWLSEVGVNKTTIGVFVLTTLPYTLKFLWAPLLDHARFPILEPLLGRRKAWMVASQLCLMFCLVRLGLSDPAHHLEETAFWAFMVALSSATQDTAIEAYRIELFQMSQMRLGASASVVGYRMGMWISGAGALYLASSISWPLVYILMAACISLGIVAVLLAPEAQAASLASVSEAGKTLKARIQTSFLSLISQPGVWFALPLILFYKAGDTLLNAMTAPFLLDIGFSKIEIAHVAKSFGIAAMIFGGLSAGSFLRDRALNSMIRICFLLQLASCLLYAAQAEVGHHLGLLFFALGFENFATGFASAVFITYLSGLCSKPHTATHFALLASFASFSRVMFSTATGWLADHVSWSMFYGLGAALAFLGWVVTQNLFQNSLQISQHPPLPQRP
ncbi:MAG: AmpG family muropeptide MFS transporter [Holosporales bacterium]